MNYRFDGKQKTLALGMYPTMSLAQARQRREEARKLLAGVPPVDPGRAKRGEKLTRATVAAQTLEVVARQFLAKTEADRSDSTQHKEAVALENNVFPFLGKEPVSSITPLNVLSTVQKMEARGAIDTGHLVK